MSQFKSNGVLLQNRICDAIAQTDRGKHSKKYFDFAVADAAMSFEDKGTEAGILNNFQRIMDSDLGQALTQSTDYGPYVMEVWPVVTAWYPDFPLKDLICVQPMDKPLAYLFFSKLMTGTTKSPTSAGEVVETPLGKRKIRGQYPTGEVMGEDIKTFENDGTHTIALLAYNPLNIAANYLENYMLVITGGAAAGTHKYLNVANGNINLTKDGTTASGVYIEIDTGAIYVPETTKAVTEIVANYVWNLDFANDTQISQVKENIEMLPMEAIPRALAMKWTIFSEYLKKSQFGTDIRVENTKRILNLLYQFQVRYILDQLYDYSTGNEGQVYPVTIPSSTTMSVEVKAQVVSQTLKQAATMIEMASGRIEGNRVVCGKNLKSFLESLPNTLFTKTPTPSGFSGPREIGEFGTFKVYYDPWRGDNEAFMTYRGTEWYDASYYLGEFMPIVPTDAIALGVQVREAFCSMEAYKYHKPNCVIKMSITLA